LAFSTGQCHGLDLALHERNGWPLVAIDNADGTRAHVCVRREDGALVDVSGAHSEAEHAATRPGATFTAIDRKEIERLQAEAEWAVAAESEAGLWVEQVLEGASRAPELPANPRLVISWQNLVVPDVEVRLEWEGDRTFRVLVRDPRASAPWGSYGHVELPRDQRTGGFVIDFSPDAFDPLAERWMRQFDLEKARRKVRGASDR
jgi:hypothetical protein